MRDTERRSWSLGDVGIRLLILGLAALLLMALQITGRLTSVQSAITQLTSPAQVGATGVTETVADAVSFVSQLRRLRQRNAELEQVNSSLLVENFGLREVERENQTLREMLKFAADSAGSGIARRPNYCPCDRPREQQLSRLYYVGPGQGPWDQGWHGGVDGPGLGREN